MVNYEDLVCYTVDYVQIYRELRMSPKCEVAP